MYKINLLCIKHVDKKKNYITALKTIMLGKSKLGGFTRQLLIIAKILIRLEDADRSSINPCLISAQILTI